MVMKQHKAFWIVIVSVTWVIGCIPTVSIQENLIETLEIKLSRAKSIEAELYAPLEVRQAEQKIEQAKTAIKRLEYESAIRLVEKAEMDIKVAEAKSLAEKAKKTEKEMQKSIEQLKKEKKAADK